MQNNPDIPQSMLGKWQRVVDLLSSVTKVPASLIMKTNAPRHSVLVANQTDENPYKVGQSFVLNDNLYCQGVLEAGGELVVTDARKQARWCNNDDLEFGMTFYVGYPLYWPDGNVFGTICVLDRHENDHALECRDLIGEFKGVVETDLALLVEIERRKTVEQELKYTLEQLETRVERRTRQLSEANTALRVLLERVENARAEQDAELSRQIDSPILPQISRLKSQITDDPAAGAFLAVLESNLKTITSPLAHQMVSALEPLTPTESEIAQMIVQGRTTKDIARIMSRGTSTIDFHRNNIRKKLGLGRQPVNLRNYLSSRLQ